MPLTRREFIKTSAAVGVLAALAKLLPEQIASAFKKVEAPEAAGEEVWVPTTCWIGKQECGILARVIDGRVVRLYGDPKNPRNKGKLCIKGLSQIQALYHPYRIKAPLKRVNEKGVPGKWVEISWDEALNVVADELRKTMAKNPELILWQKGRSKAKAFYDKGFAKKTIGATAVGHGAFCSDVGYRVTEYTIGQHGNFQPDFRYCNYLVSWGWNIVNAGGNKLCWMTWPQELVQARERGMKVVHIDPLEQTAGPHADEWIPIKPATDLAFWLAIVNVLIREGFVDREYLKKYTNAPFLVKEDGYFLRVDGKEQVFDTVQGTAKPYDAPGVDPALEGEYVVNGVKVKPALQVLKEHVATYTPEWASRICDVPADVIERIGRELGENARIGSTVVLDGVELPYRPVGVMGYHVTQQVNGFQASRAVLIALMLLGAIGAVGGVQADLGFTKPKVHGGFKKWDAIKVEDKVNIFLHPKYFPIVTPNSSVLCEVMLNPEKYGVPKGQLPEVLILHMVNPLRSFVQPKLFMEAYRKFRFVVSITPWMDDTTSYFADIVLPCGTIDKYEGPMHVYTPYEDAYDMRIPPIGPMYQSKSEIDIYTDICEKLGLLEKYVKAVVEELGIKPEYAEALPKKPTARDYLDAWAKSKGIPGGIEYFEKHGAWFVREIPAKVRYPLAWDPPFLGIRLRLYGESLKRYQDEMKKLGVPEIFYRGYTPLPEWIEPVMEKSPPEYRFTLISFKKIEFKQARAAHIPMLAELEPHQELIMNVKAAEELGLKDRDEVWVESHNPVTGETAKVKTVLKLVEGIRPDTVSLSHHYGHTVQEIAKGRGPTPNDLFFTGEGFVDITQDQTFQVRVNVYKA